MLVDANLLLYAVDESSSLHAPALRWWESALEGPARVALPWVSLSAFLRISTNPRAMHEPLAPRVAVDAVREWLRRDGVWSPAPGPGFAEAFLSLVQTHEVRGNLVTDAQLAALAIEHGLVVYSADSDFARFAEVTWVNPVAV